MRNLCTAGPRSVRSQRRPQRRCPDVVAACVLALVVALCPGAGLANERCTGSWLVAADSCYAAIPRADCGTLVPRWVERYRLQGTGPVVIGPYTTTSTSCGALLHSDISKHRFAGDAQQKCQKHADETVRRNLDEHYRGICGRPMFLERLCQNVPGT